MKRYQKKLKYKKKLNHKRNRKKPNRDFNSACYKEFRKIVSKRDNRECMICSYLIGIKTKGRVNVHHIKGWSEYPLLRYQPKNGCVVCWEHHKEINKNEYMWVEILQQLVKKSELKYIKKNDISPYATTS